MAAKIRMYLDTRREKDSGVYPLKLQAYDTETRKQTYVSTVFEFTKEEYSIIWESEKPSKTFKAKREEIKSLLIHAEEVAEKITPFNLSKFKVLISQKKDAGKTISHHYEERIKELDVLERISSKSGFKYSKKSLSEYAQHKGTTFPQLQFKHITPNWLEGYQQYMDNLGKSKTTIGMYLRPLKAMFNRAIDEGDIDRTIYPFGNKKKNKYQIPTGSNVKRPLTTEQLGRLFHAESKTKEQQKAKDFWFFSYGCNGMNIKDIALLTFKDLKDDHFTFFRAKTKNSATSGKPITIYFNSYIESIIDKYGNDNNGKNYIFPILKNETSKEDQQREIKNFVRFINQHIKTLAKNNELPDGISTYWARHSFATNAVRGGHSMEFIQESLGHGDMKTTMNYFAGFEDETKKKFAETLMNF